MCLLQKKPTLAPGDFINYQPVSNVLFWCKVIELVVAGQLQAFLNKADYLDPFQLVSGLARN